MGRHYFKGKGVGVGIGAGCGFGVGWGFGGAPLGFAGLGAGGGCGIGVGIGWGFGAAWGSEYINARQLAEADFHTPNPLQRLGNFVRRVRVQEPPPSAAAAAAKPNAAKPE